MRQVRALVPRKAPPFTELTVAGMRTVFKAVHEKKVAILMDVVVDGQVTEVRALHSEKQEGPMDVTPSGMTIFTIPLFEKAELPITWTDRGI